MREIRDTIDIAAPPERLWEWLSGLVEHYPEWHPDHISAMWERGQPNRVGSILRAVESLGGKRELLRFRLTRVEPPNRFEYRFLGPVSVLLPRGRFWIIAQDGGSRFVAGISYRFGPFAERVFSRRTGVLRAHMKEEGENLKQIMEGAGGDRGGV